MTRTIFVLLVFCLASGFFRSSEDRRRDRKREIWREVALWHESAQGRASEARLRARAGDSVLERHEAILWRLLAILAAGSGTLYKVRKRRRLRGSGGS